MRVVTELTITGKVAQFGRGVLADVSTKLLDQFVQSLERDVLTGTSGATGPSPASPATTESATTGPSPAGPATTGPATSGPATTATASAGPATVEPTTNGSAAGTASTAARRIEAPEAEPVDLLGTAGVPVAKRLLPLLVGLAVLLVAVLGRKRRRGRRRAAR